VGGPRRNNRIETLADTIDAINERTRREHLDDPPAPARRPFSESLTRLLTALEPDRRGAVCRRALAVAGREALVETVLWDSLRHFDAHRECLERLRAEP